MGKTPLHLPGKVFSFFMSVWVSPESRPWGNPAEGQRGTLGCHGSPAVKPPGHVAPWPPGERPRAAPPLPSAALAHPHWEAGGLCSPLRAGDVGGGGSVMALGHRLLLSGGCLCPPTPHGRVEQLLSG